MTARLPEDDSSIEITGDDDAWFAALEAGEFAQRWAMTEQAIAAEALKARDELHRETSGSIPYATHRTLDASEA